MDHQADQIMAGPENMASPGIIRSRAAVVINLDDLGLAAPERLLGAIPQWSRSADLYAVVLRSAPRLTPPSAPRGQLEGPDSHAVAAAFATVLWRIDCFPKPTIALIEGRLSPWAIGATAYTTHRVAGDDFSVSMATHRLDGVLPLGGSAHLLARLPHAAGVMLALTGQAIGAADAYALGLVSHVIPSRAFPAIIAALSDGDPVDPLLDDLHHDPGPITMAHHLDACSRCFSEPRLDDILSALQREHGASAAWAHAAHDAIMQSARIEHELALRHIRAAAESDVRDALILAYRIARHRHSVTEVEQVDALFYARRDDDLPLGTRADIAAGRF